MRPTRSTALLASLALAAVLSLTGCDPTDNSGFTSELNDPNYVRGGQLKKLGRTQEALSAYIKVIDRRGGDAPESHLEAALLYYQTIKDPIPAIYHFNRYLEQKPNSSQAEMVRGMIDQSKKEFAKSLPAQPFESGIRRQEMYERVDQLTKENFQLKEEIARLRGVPITSRPRPEPQAEPDEPAPTAVAANDDPAPAVVPVPQDPRPQTQAVQPSRPNNPPAQQTAGGRIHTVSAKESLYGISTRYYGNGRRMRDIVAANPGVLQNENTPLKIGMQLRIPQ